VSFFERRDEAGEIRENRASEVLKGGAREIDNQGNEVKQMMLSKIAKLGVSLAAAALAMVSQVGDVDAGTLNVHGAAFVSYDAGYANDIDYLTSGVRTTATTGRRVIAAVPYQASSARYQWVRIFGLNYSGSTTQFTAFTYDLDGNFRDAISMQTEEGNYETGAILATTPDTMGTDDDVFVSIYAELPANGGGVVRGVTILPYNW
jgi:hypothetical protein